MSDNEIGWEVFEKINYRAAERVATFYKGGQLSLTKALHDELGTDTVELLYNRSVQKIGVRRTNESNPNAFKFRNPSRQSSWVTSVAAFLKYYDLDRVKGNKYPASYEDGMIVIDIAKPI